MTDMSLRVYHYPKDLTAEQLETPQHNLATLCSLDRYARHCGPYALQAWAVNLGLRVYHVDNCWVRVPVDKVALSAFLRGLPADPQLDSLELADGRYLIEAEEF